MNVKGPPHWAQAKGSEKAAVTRKRNEPRCTIHVVTNVELFDRVSYLAAHRDMSVSELIRRALTYYTQLAALGGEFIQYNGRRSNYVIAPVRRNQDRASGKGYRWGSPLTTTESLARAGRSRH